MKKYLPFLISILVLIIGLYLRRFAPQVINLYSVEFSIIKGVGISGIFRSVSLGIVTLITIFTLLKYRYSSIQLWFICCFITAMISRLLIIDIAINIKSLSWLPIFKLSYLTVIIASMIIILSLLIEDRSTNE